ncbi:MAG: S8 family serine peptidase [Candidatus Levybacteria bacterium]|nr:S8 family serine peptidase [Candidatus Levybacteria bacterium]
MFSGRFRYVFIASLLLLFVLGGVLLFQAGLKVKAQGKPDVIPNNFIVVLKDNVGNPQDVANEMARTHGLSVEHVYTTALKGFSATIPQARLIKVKGDPRVQFVSEDRVVEAFAQSTPAGISRVNAPVNPNKGTGIGVAVIDTGIDLTHPDLQANIVANKSCIRGKRTGNDDNGHGSHVAGTIAALNNTVGVVGVSPEAKLLAVKVLNSAGSGSWSTVICGVDWVTANAGTYNIKVANMSLGGGGSSDNNCGNTNNDALHKAICKSTAVGIIYAVAAGNSTDDASKFVPAAYDDTVITVSALADSDGQPGGLGGATSYGADDTFASFSNYGNVVDLGAPGVSIYSTWKSGGYNTISGTSMASPHVAGSAALYVKSHPGSTWSQVRDGLVAEAEALNAGHTDSSGLHPEPVVEASTL